MFNENKESKLNDNEKISQERLNLLEHTIGIMKQELSEEELQQINAIVLYGSTTINKAKETSDIDLLISFEKFSKDIFFKIKSIFERELPDLEISFNFGSLSPKTKSTRITVRSLKNPDEIARWEFLYTKDEETRDKLNTNLEESQKFWEHLGWNKNLHDFQK